MQTGKVTPCIPAAGSFSLLGLSLLEGESDEGGDACGPANGIVQHKAIRATMQTAPRLECRMRRILASLCLQWPLERRIEFLRPVFVAKVEVERSQAATICDLAAHFVRLIGSWA